MQQGQTIGYVGATGLATASHLHYELREHGRPIDARKAKLPDGAPVPASHEDEYAALVRERVALLELARPSFAVHAAASLTTDR